MDCLHNRQIGQAIRPTFAAVGNNLRLQAAPSEAQRERRRTGSCAAVGRKEMDDDDDEHAALAGGGGPMRGCGLAGGGGRGQERR